MPPRRRSPRRRDRPSRCSEGAADLNRQTLAYIEENVAASFKLAANLVQARTVEEVAALQQEFLRRQMAAAAEQGKSLGGMVGRATQERSTRPRNRPRRGIRAQGSRHDAARATIDLNVKYCASQKYDVAIAQ